jgi:hypothetical protein
MQQPPERTELTMIIRWCLGVTLLNVMTQGWQIKPPRSFRETRKGGGQGVKKAVDLCLDGARKADGFTVRSSRSS